jgi:argininosuccinate lyase
MMTTAPEYSGVSSLMPQKYNPTVTEITRTRSSLALGMAQSVMNTLTKCNFGDVREYDGVWSTTLATLEKSAAMIKLTGGVVESMILHKDRMLELAGSGFQTASELADEIYRQTKIAYRTSHGVVANVVNQALDAGLQAVDITPEMVDKAAQKVIGKPLGMSKEDILRCVDPTAFVKSHNVMGGPAPEEVLRVIGERRTRLAADRERQAERRARVEAGDKLLRQAMADLAAS